MAQAGLWVIGPLSGVRILYITHIEEKDMARRKTGKLRRRRKHLWESDPNCVFCGRMTVLPKRGVKHGQTRDNLATIEHLDSKYNLMRGKFKNTERTVLCCWRCNNDRNKCEQQNVPIDELHQRSGYDD